MIKEDLKMYALASRIKPYTPKPKQLERIQRYCEQIRMDRKEITPTLVEEYAEHDGYFPLAATIYGCLHQLYPARFEAVYEITRLIQYERSVTTESRDS
jgi:hypothetical protein